MGRSSFMRQFLALMKRNFILKKRNKKQTLQEILMPIYYVAILAMIRVFAVQDSQAPVSYFPEHNITSDSYYPDPMKILLVTPNTSQVESIVIEALDLLASSVTNGTLNVSSYEMFASVEASEEEYTRNSSIYEMGIDFEDGTLQSLSYTIRLPHTRIPDTEPVVGLYGSQGSCRTGEISSCWPANSYLSTGFINMQKALDTTLIRLKSGHDVPQPELKIQQFPKDTWTRDSSFIQILASIYFVFAYSPFVNFMIVNLVTEKEKKIKEGMRMMGMRDSAFWASWSLTYAILIAVVTAICVLISFAAKLLQNSNFFIFYLILFEYGLTILSMSFMLTTFFNKAETAGGLASLATMVFSLLYLPVSLTRTYGPGGPVSSIPVGGQWALCLLSPVALALAIDQAFYLDIAQNGMNWDTLTFGQFPLYASMLMLFIDFILYGVIAVYLDNVIPGEYGQTRKPYYFLQPSFWFPKKHEFSSQVDVQQTYAFSNDLINNDTENISSELEEPVSDEYKGRDHIRINNIRKEFTSKLDRKLKVVAVDGISLKLYEGQITCLLGHNGAGKTTLINILTGMTPASSGSAFIYSHNVSNADEMDQIRGMTGVCPQHNILLDSLTCKEHLEFFGALKGVMQKDMNQEVQKALKDIDISDQADTLARKLSGGQKRKLCVALALIGNPKVIFLDEPSAGMDPYSRRHLWSLLKERRHDKVILLTTHFMDEADILADRKAFISKGKLQCVGSSLFLKNRFGVGYHLNLVVDSEKYLSGVQSIISEHVPQVQFDRIHGKEFHFTLPLNAVKQFPDLFTDLDKRGHSVGITSYGISMTSLEEVFLKLGIVEESHEEEESVSSNINSPLLENRNAASVVEHKYKVKARGSGANSVSPAKSKGEADTEKEEDTIGSRQAAIEGAGPSMTHGGSKTVFTKIPPVKYVDEEHITSQRFWTLVKFRFILLTKSPVLFVFRIILPVIFVVVGAAVSKFASTGQDINQKIYSLNLNAALYSHVRPESTQNPPMLYSTSPPVGINATDFITGIQAQQIELMNISNFNGSAIFPLSPSHMGVNIYDVSLNASNRTLDSYILTGVFNDTATHSLPVIVNVISNSLLYLATSLSAGVENITTYVKPWPYQPTVALTFDNGVFSSVILLGIAMSIVPAGFGIQIVTERELKIRGQLRISGVHMNTYWGSAFFVDYLQFLFVSVMSIVVVYIFQIEAIMYGGAALALILVYLFYMPVNIFMAYCLSFLFDKRETAQAAIFNIFFLLSFIPFMAVALTDMNGLNRPAEIIHYILTAIDPPYAAFGGLYYIFRVYLIQSIIQLTTSPEIPFSTYFKWDSGIPITLLAPLAHAIWLFFLMRVLEVKKTGGAIRDAFCFGKGLRIQKGVANENNDVDADEDEDIKYERQIVRDLMGNIDTRQAQMPVILVENLRKEFVKVNSTFESCTKKKSETIKVAVRNNTFHVKGGDVFGLLGPNGAGKTTALNMLIAEEGPTKGRVVVDGYDIRSSLSSAFQAMGYCPQHDALWEDLTLKDHLEIYSLLRGITKEDTVKIVNYFFESLKIEEHADKRSKKLSGGTKRKLSYAISMLGQAKVVLLDEPSTGMDPQSKRFMWDTISESFSDSKRGAILTTHYMEEADALCSRVAIMVNGQIECIGSTQHLKNKYGSGYLLEIKLDLKHLSRDDAGISQLQDDFMKKLDDFVKDVFSGAVLTECFGDRAMYAIPQSEVQSLGNIFSLLEKEKETLHIEEYSFSQSSLEQVFLDFAKQQVDEGDHDEDKASKKEFSKKRALMKQQSLHSNNEEIPSTTL